MKVALLEYYLTDREALVFVGKAEWDEPRVFRLGALRRANVALCADRLLVDFHGIRTAEKTRSQEHCEAALHLPPAIRRMQRDYRQFSPRLLKVPKLKFGMDYWEGLSDVLLPPELRRVLDDIDLLCIAPHGPLHRLPFASLRWDAGTYLIERFGLCHVPSASLLRFCQARNERRRNPTVRPASGLFAAASALEDRGDDEAEAFEPEIRTLSRLLERRLEMTCLAGSPDLATKERLTMSLAGKNVIHLACHGVFSGDYASSDPLDSALVLSDGHEEPELALESIASWNEATRASVLLTAREIFTLPTLSADLVVLRACSSGRIEIRSGDELMGLLRGFLYAGTPSLVASLWNVAKRSSRDLLEHFYTSWLTGEQMPAKWESLRYAQIETMRNPETSHPYHWAPFVLLGDWL